MVDRRWPGHGRDGPGRGKEEAGIHAGHVRVERFVWVAPLRGVRAVDSGLRALAGARRGRCGRRRQRGQRGSRYEVPTARTTGLTLRGPHGPAVVCARPRYPAAKSYPLAVDGKSSCNLAIAYARPQHLAAWLHGIYVDRARPHDLTFDCPRPQYSAGHAALPSPMRGRSTLPRGCAASSSTGTAARPCR